LVEWSMVNGAFWYYLSSIWGLMVPLSHLQLQLPYLTCCSFLFVYPNRPIQSCDIHTIASHGNMLIHFKYTVDYFYILMVFRRYARLCGVVKIERYCYWHWSYFYHIYPKLDNFHVFLFIWNW
jgi:hypothetical protein